MVHIVHEAIEYNTLCQRVRRPDCGAVVAFLGTVRDLTGDRVTVALDYEAYPAMAEQKMAEIERDTRERWPVGEIAMVHRARPSASGRHQRRGRGELPASCRRRSRLAGMPSIGSRNWCRSGRRKTGLTAPRSGFTPRRLNRFIYATSVDRHFRPYSQQPSHQRHRSLQLALHLLHGRGCAIHGPHGVADLRGNRALRPDRGPRSASTRFA